MKLIILFLVLTAGASAQSVGTLRATIVDDCGRPVAGARLRVGGRVGAAAPQSGRVVLAGLEIGAHDGELIVDGRAPRTVSFEISGGRVTDLGPVVMGEDGSVSCSYVGLYRDSGTVRVITMDSPESSTTRSIAFRVTTDCAGDCE